MCYSGNHKETFCCEAVLISKCCHGSDSSLQLENLKMESLVIVHKEGTVNFILLLYTPPVKLRELVLLLGIHHLYCMHILFMFFIIIYISVWTALFVNIVSVIEVKS